jgi:hypothetical protein
MCLWQHHWQQPTTFLCLQTSCCSYETLRKHTEALAGVCDVLVCDEGHRLKATGGNKTIDALKQLGCKRHIVLTGTPLQVWLIRPKQHLWALCWVAVAAGGGNMQGCSWA